MPEAGRWPPAKEGPLETLYLLIPLSVVLVLAAGAVFWWALASGQFDDLEGPAHRILMDEEPPNCGAVDADQIAAKGPH